MRAAHASAILCEIRRDVPAVYEAAENMAESLKTALAGACSRSDAFAAELLLREALTNAIAHGSGIGRNRAVETIIRVRTDRVIMAIDDKGAGFGWRIMMTSVAHNSDMSGRGGEIYRAFASQVRFNGTGNKVILVRRFSQGNGTL